MVSRDWQIPTSIRLTSVKPSGSISLLPGSTPGIHFGVSSRFHIRRVRVAVNDPLSRWASACGYHVERAVGDAYTNVVEFPCDYGPGVRSEAEASMQDQLDCTFLAARHWADNAVSVTVKADEAELRSLRAWLPIIEQRVKAISFLPRSDHVYAQAPYEAITEAEYRARLADVRPVPITAGVEAVGERYCTNDSCGI